MNLAALYCDCHFENMLVQLDYKMHLYLKPDKRDQWVKKFNEMEQFQKTCEESLKNITSTSSMTSVQIQTVTKWFIHSLSGPFGVVTGLDTKKMARLGFMLKPNLLKNVLCYPA